MGGHKTLVSKGKSAIAGSTSTYCGGGLKVPVGAAWPEYH